MRAFLNIFGTSTLLDLIFLVLLSLYLMGGFKTVLTIIGSKVGLKYIFLNLMGVERRHFFRRRGPMLKFWDFAKPPYLFVQYLPVLSPFSDVRFLLLVHCAFFYFFRRKGSGLPLKKVR